MGNGIRKIKRQLAGQQIALVDTKTAFNNCKILLGNLNPSVAKKAAVQFADFLAFLNSRASLVNIGDIMNASLVMRDRISKEEPIIKGYKWS